ncbi:MAG: DUF427 domain-containing protein [Pseudomonadota bacterium]
MTLPTENVQDYPRPPALEPAPWRIEVVFAGQSVADTTGALRVLETHHPPTYYLPRADVTADLIEVAGRSFCEWKGAATYFDIRAGGRTAARAAWTYRAPTKRFRDLVDMIAIYPALMDKCRVAGVAVIPQAGDFYGGWWTPNLEGSPKGAPGTEHW